MRVLSQELQDNLDSGVTTLCWCWKIIRKDGVILGFTEHDSDLYFDNLLWSAGAGLTPGMIESAIGFATDTGLASGALQQSGISETDIKLGKYEQAAIEIWRVDWRNPELRIGMWSGEIGEISQGKNSFAAEIAGPARKLNRGFGRVFSKRCDAELGDMRCTKDVSASPFSSDANIVNLLGEAMYSIAPINTPDDDWYSDGIVRWTGGENTGQTQRIARYFHNGASDVFLLTETPLKPVIIGDAVTLTAGCNKSIEHCQTKFNNILSFRGCPFMPGNDSIIAGANNTP